jgi:DnaJ-class molecular chaperone
MSAMATERDYYEVLGVARTASDGEIATAYRRLAIKYHPDKNPGDQDAIERFKEAAEAFEVLNDPDKRSRYDRFGHAGLNGSGFRSHHFADVEDIFSAFGDIFGDLFGGGRNRPRKGRDVRCDITPSRSTRRLRASKRPSSSSATSGARTAAEAGPQKVAGARFAAIVVGRVASSRQPASCACRQRARPATARVPP